MKAVRKHRIRRVLLVIIPVAISVIFSAFICHSLQEKKFIIDVNNQLEAVKTVIGIWGTILGFVFAAESILIAFEGSKLTAEIKETGHYKTVLFIYMETCVVLLICLSIFVPLIIANYFNMFCMIFVYCGMHCNTDRYNTVHGSSFIADQHNIQIMKIRIYSLKAPSRGAFFYTKI